MQSPELLYRRASHVHEKLKDIPTAIETTLQLAGELLTVNVSAYPEEIQRLGSPLFIGSLIEIARAAASHLGTVADDLLDGIDFDQEVQS